MRIFVRHITTYNYDPPADKVGVRMRLFPSEFDGQSVEDWQVTVNGEEITPLLTTGFGDRIGLCLHHSPVAEMVIVAQGHVVTEDRSGIVKGLNARPPRGVFLRQTPLTRLNDDIRELAEGAARSDPLEELHAICSAVRAAVDYRPGTTSANTTAAEALQLGAGVCQDHAHLFIAAARARGHPARYLTGYLLSNEDEEEINETHAWGEALIDGVGWVGFDPANEICPTERYIRLACGLDARGAAPLRGTITGGSEENLVASVGIEQAQ